MTLLMTDGVTISQEIEPCPSCNPLSEKAQRPFSTVSKTGTEYSVPVFFIAAPKGEKLFFRQTRI